MTDGQQETTKKASEEKSSAAYPFDLIPGYEWNIGRYVNLYISAFQHEVEKAFVALSDKYSLNPPLLYSHNAILQTLYYHQEPLSFVEIHKISGQAMPNISKAAASLRSSGLIVCSATQGDKRKYNASLTDFGRKICNDYLENYLIQIDRQLRAGISKEEQLVVQHYFEKIEYNVYELHRKEKSFSTQEEQR